MIYMILYLIRMILYDLYDFIEFGSPSGAASNLGLTIVNFADFSGDDYDCDRDLFYNVLRLVL